MKEQARPARKSLVIGFRNVCCRFDLAAAPAAHACRIVLVRHPGGPPARFAPAARTARG